MTLQRTVFIFHYTVIISITRRDFSSDFKYPTARKTKSYLDLVQEIIIFGISIHKESSKRIIILFRGLIIILLCIKGWIYSFLLVKSVLSIASHEKHRWRDECMHTSDLQMTWHFCTLFLWSAHLKQYGSNNKHKWLWLTPFPPSPPQSLGFQYLHILGRQPSEARLNSEQVSQSFPEQWLC